MESTNFSNISDVTGTLYGEPGSQRVLYFISAILNLFCTLLCGFGNILVVTSVFKFTYLRSTTHAFVVMLACFDLSLGMLQPLEQYILISTLDTIQTNVMLILCRIAGVALAAVSLGDTLSIMFLVIDRFIYIMYPLKYSTIVTRRKVAMAVCFSIMYSISIGLIVFLKNGAVTKGKICNTIEIIPCEGAHVVLPLIVVVCVVLVIFYSKIALLACKHHNQIATVATSVQGSESNCRTLELSAQLKVTRVISIVIGVYLLTNIPLTVTVMVSTGEKTAVERAMLLLNQWIWRINTWINPFIYGYMNRDFRRAFRTLLGMKNVDNQVAPAAAAQNFTPANTNVVR